MPNGINNWQYRDVTDFLKENGFVLNHQKGSHIFYVGIYNKTQRHVCVPFHGTVAIKPRTMKGIILQSGIPKEKWLSGK